MMSKKLKYIDLFSGCGGLSLGLEKARFDLVLAVEKSNMAAETFYHNFIERGLTSEKWESHCSLPIEGQFKKKLVVNGIDAILTKRSLLTQLKNKNIDLVVGGPPCQGFSMAGRRRPKDARNQLPWQFLDFVEKVNPKVVVMENVVGMRRKFSKHNHDSPFEDLKFALETSGEGYVVQALELNAMHYGVPQHRPRVILVGVRKNLPISKKISILPGVWSSMGYVNKDNAHIIRPTLAPKPSYSGDSIRNVRDAFADLNDKGYKFKTRQDYNLPHHEYAKRMRYDKSWMKPHIKSLNGFEFLKNHRSRNHGERVVTRFMLHHALKEYGIPSIVFSIPRCKKYKKGEVDEVLLNLLRGITWPLAYKDTVLATSRAELVSLVKELATKKHSQRLLKKREPSPTVLSIPDDYIHPVRPRALTVREMARLQSFPDTFVFQAKETTGGSSRGREVPQYTQVANAVPPLLAYELGKHISNLLKK